MYRIELSPGDETVFRSIEELAVAIKRGVVTSRARIFHNASSQWLPIQFHPHYKAAVSMPLTQAELVAGPQVKPLSTLSLEQAPEPEPSVTFPLPASRVVTAAAEPPAKKQKASTRLKSESRSRRRSKPRRQLRMALVGALLVGGAQWVLSGPLFSRTGAPALISIQRHLIMEPTAAMKRVSSPNTAAMFPVLPRTASAQPPAALEGVVQPYARVTAPSFGGTSAVETAAAPTEPPPSSIELAAPLAQGADSLTAAAKSVDSSGHKAMQGVLTTVSGGAPPAQKSAPKQ